MARLTPKPIGYRGPFKTMEDIYQKYRTSLMNREPYRAYLNTPKSYGGYSNRTKSSYSPDRHRPERREGERKETKPIEIKPAEIPVEENKTERKNIQELYNSEISTPRHLPTVELGERKFFLDERLEELRDVENPANSISFKDLDLVPEKTEQENQYEIERRADVKEIFGLPKYQNEIELGQTDIIKRNRPSPYDDKIESRW